MEYKVEHFTRESAAIKRAGVLSRKWTRPVYAILRPDGDGRWHVGGMEILGAYKDRQRYFCSEVW